MKRIIAMLIIMSVIMGVTAFADNDTSFRYTMTDGKGEKLIKFFCDVENGEASIVDVKIYGGITDLIFPAELEGYPVTKIEKLNQSDLQKNLKDSLRTVKFEDGIEKIEGVFLSHFPNIREVYLPKTLKEGDFTFWDCPRIESVTIPASLKEIPQGCFDKCDSLSKVIIEDGVEKIGPDAFSRCPSLASIDIPDSVTVIANGAFFACTNLKKVNMSQGVESIGNDAFNATAIESIKLPKCLEEISNNAFEKTPIKELVLPSGLKNIGEYAFSHCENLEKLSISGKTKVQRNAFNSCTALDDVTVDGEMSKGLFETLYKDTPYGEKYVEEYNGDFVIIDGCLVRYAGKDKNPIIPDAVKELGEEAFRRTEIDTVTFPNNTIEEIPKMCFLFSQIKELTIPSTVKHVREEAFMNCQWLKKLTIEDGVESVANNAFMNCYSLVDENVSIGKKVRVSKDAFKQTQMDKELIEGGGWISGFVTPEGKESPKKTTYINARQNEHEEAYAFSDMESSEASVLLQRLGIISGYEDGAFRPNNYVTRAEAVKIIIKALGYSDKTIEELTEDLKNGSIYNDVAETADYNDNHWANTYLQLGMNENIISGFEDGTLRPDDRVTLEQLLTMLVNITGYDIYAQAEGGYPTGYIKWARSQGIADNLNAADYTQNATRAETLNCVFNAVNVPDCILTAWDITWNGESAPTYAVMDGEGRNFQNLLTRNYAIYTIEGEIDNVIDETVSVYILSAVNFDEKKVEDKDRRIIEFINSGAYSFKKGDKYKMYIEINDSDEMDYELLCAFPI